MYASYQYIGSVTRQLRVIRAKRDGRDIGALLARPADFPARCLMLFVGVDHEMNL